MIKAVRKGDLGAQDQVDSTLGSVSMNDDENRECSKHAGIRYLRTTVRMGDFGRWDPVTVVEGENRGFRTEYTVVTCPGTRLVLPGNILSHVPELKEAEGLRGWGGY